MRTDINDKTTLLWRMQAPHGALTSVMDINGNEKFKVLTSRYSKNLSVNVEVAKKFLEEHKNKLTLIHYGLNTDLYVLKTK
jgi:hypothetical protein